MSIQEISSAPDLCEMELRLKRVRSALAAQDLDGYLCFLPPNILWLTNFLNYVHERVFLLYIPATGPLQFVVPLLELEHVKTRCVGPFEATTYAEFPAPVGQRWQDSLAKVLPASGRIGVETMLPKAIDAEIKAQTVAVDIVEQLREIKSSYEVGRIAYGSRLLSEAHQSLMDMATQGITQTEVNAKINRSLFAQMVKDEPSLNPFATSLMTMFQNPDVSHDPHNFTDLDMVMQPGGPHVTVFNALMNGYGAEIERTFFLGQVPEAAKRPFETMMQARRMVFESIKPGAAMGDIDRAVNHHFETSGYGAARRHRAGHGLGVTAHEGPFLADGDEGIIKPGMVFTIEPGLYLPGIGGFRHSDTVLITDDGYRCLTFGADDLDSLTF